MANQGNQKLKLMHVLDIFRRYSDEEHPVTTPFIIEKLEEVGIASERKSIYRDIQVLCEFGAEIEKSTEKSGYYLASREFELPELKLLVDAVAASKFITEKKSRELVAKIEALGSVYQGRQLQRQVVVSDRVKNVNEQIYYAIDVIYQCIDNNHQMSFQYVEWNERKEQVLRHEGRRYLVSPAFLLWDNEYYYLVAYDEEVEQIRHYRVDKIRSAKEEEDKRSGIVSEIQRGSYSKKRFSMFAGEEKTVTLSAQKYMAGVLIDRFGQEISIRNMGDRIQVRLDVEVSEQFFGWLTGLGGKIIIEGPEGVRESYASFLREIIKEYK